MFVTQEEEDDIDGNADVPKTFNSELADVETVMKQLYSRYPNKMAHDRVLDIYRCKAVKLPKVDYFR